MRSAFSATAALVLARLLPALLLLAPDAQARPLPHILAEQAARPRAPLLAPAAFEQPARLRNVSLAPDGAHLAYVEHEGQGEGAGATLHVLALAGGAPRSLMAVDAQASVHWSTDGSTLFVTQAEGLAAVVVRDGAANKILAFAKDEKKRFTEPDPSRPRHLILRERDPAGRTSRVLRIDAKGKSELLYDGPGAVQEVLVGADGKLALMRRVDQQFQQLILRRSGAGWTEVTRCKPFQACSLVAQSADGSGALLRASPTRDREGLHEFRPGAKFPHLVHDDPLGLADIARVIPSPHSGQPMLAAYLLPRYRMAGIDAAGRRIAADIARRFPEGELLAENCARTACLFSERGARLSQPRFWIYDLQRRSWQPVLETMRARGRPLPEHQLASTTPLHYRASDGALVHGYLTVPPGLPTRSLPMVTLVHGGPWSRADGGYSPLVQLLANRGYAVFQPNFRGSTGYGERYTRAPGADYGNGRVQADIIDGVRWLLAKGVGDPKRQGITGASFGGYATLLALSHTPGLFRFGMAAQPPTDLAHVMRQSAAAPAAPGEPPFGQLLHALGIDLENPAHLGPMVRDAPLRHAGRIAAPLLLVAGGKDEKVGVETVVDYVARLQSQGKQVGLVLDTDEGHNPRDPLARRAQTYLLLRMLHRYLGGPQVEPDEAVAAYLARTMRVNRVLEP